MQYCRIEEGMLHAALEAVAPRERGRKPRVIDPRIAELEGRMVKTKRDRELLELKAKELQRVDDDAGDDGDAVAHGQPPVRKRGGFL